MKIIYTGIGCNETEIHTEREFIDIMNRLFTYKTWNNSELVRERHYQLNYKNWNLPNDFILFTLHDWLDYSGAEIYYESE
jgi:hypothetical protein